MRTVCGVLLDVLVFFRLSRRVGWALSAESLFLRKQLALYVERKKKPRATDSVRFTLAQLSRFFGWRDALTVVKPDTLVRWHRKGFRLFWKWKSRSVGRPLVPVAGRKLIAEMAANNPTWGEERIANELLLKIGIHKCPLDPDQLAAIRRDLTLHPAIALADTLEAIQTANAWIEQETLIDKIGTID